MLTSAGRLSESETATDPGKRRLDFGFLPPDFHAVNDSFALHTCLHCRTFHRLRPEASYSTYLRASWLELFRVNAGSPSEPPLNVPTGLSRPDFPFP